MRAATALEFLGPDDVVAQLPALLDLVEETCVAANDAITERFFSRILAVSWTSEGGL